MYEPMMELRTTDAPKGKVNMFHIKPAHDPTTSPDEYVLLTAELLRTRHFLLKPLYMKRASSWCVKGPKRVATGEPRTKSTQAGKLFNERGCPCERVHAKRRPLSDIDALTIRSWSVSPSRESLRRSAPLRSSTASASRHSADPSVKKTSAGSADRVTSVRKLESSMCSSGTRSLRRSPSAVYSAMSEACCRRDPRPSRGGGRCAWKRSFGLGHAGVSLLSAGLTEHTWRKPALDSDEAQHNKPNTVGQTATTITVIRCTGEDAAQSTLEHSNALDRGKL
mmetsp:Transcript_31457/g.101761  ORF Transcript_31457/g.101761 Transcript_31457/m.101761 type:complete len:280 (-) Transcript_31457:45-884(-)